MTDREMIDGLRLYTDDDKSSESGNKKEPQREEMSKMKKRESKWFDVVLKCLALTSIFFIGTCIGAKWYDLLWSHVMNLAVVMTLIIGRKIDE